MTNKIKETLEGLERILEKLQGANIVLTIGDIQSQVKAINWGKALEEAGEELGERKQKTKRENTVDKIVDLANTTGFNEMHAIALPIIVKYKLRVAGLEKENMNFKCLAEGAAAVSLENFDKLQSAKKKIEELEKEVEDTGGELSRAICKLAIAETELQKVRELSKEDVKLELTKFVDRHDIFKATGLKYDIKKHIRKTAQEILDAREKKGGSDV